MKKIFFAGVFLIFIIVIFALSKKQSSQNGKTITINGHQFRVEIADTDEKRTRGLSGRDKLEQNEGMLFVFPSPGFYRFWMKDMKFPLDFIWIDNDKIVDLTENVSLPKSAGEILSTFSAKYPFDKVLEINDGKIKSYDIKVGDRILL